MPREDLGNWVPERDSGIMLLTYVTSSHNNIQIAQVSMGADLGWKDGLGTSEINTLWYLVTTEVY